MTNLKDRNRSGGAVLIIVLMVMLGLLGLGITALWLTSGNLAVGANVNQRTQALYAAEAGLEHARRILNRGPENNPAPNEPLTVAEMNALLAGTHATAGHDNVPSAINPDGIGATIVDRNGPPPSREIFEVPFPNPLLGAPAGETPGDFGRTPGTEDNPRPITMGTYTVWIRNNTADLRRGYYTLYQSDPLCPNACGSSVVIRSRGVAADRKTTVILESSMGGTPTNNPNPPNPGGGNPPFGYSGKNSMDDSNGVISSVVLN